MVNVVRVVIVVQWDNVRREYGRAIQVTWSSCVREVAQVSSRNRLIVRVRGQMVLVKGRLSLVRRCRQLEVLSKEGGLETTECCLSDRSCMLVYIRLWIQETIQAHLILN